MQYNESHIEDACAPQFCSRGRDYQRNGKVRDYNWNASGTRLTSTVDGSNDSIWYQEISLFIDGAELAIDGDCSCPIGYNCKHVAAALYQSVEDFRSGKLTPHQTGESENLQAWIERNQDVAGALKSHGKERWQAKRDYVIYILKNFAYLDNNKIRATSYRARRLISGTWGDKYPLSAPLWSSVNKNRRIGAGKDREILQLLAAGTTDFSCSTSLQHEHGAVLLELLIESGRCFFDDENHPALAHGGQKQAEFSWQHGKKIKLDIRLPDITNDWICVPCDPPWYIDSESHIAGPIKTPFHGHVLQHFRHLPAVSQKDANILSRYLYQAYPRGNMPLPGSLQIKKIRDKPVPVIYIFDGSKSGDVNRYCIQLKFNYGGHELQPFLVDPQPDVYIEQQNVDYHIVRQPDQEAEYIAELTNSQLRIADYTSVSMPDTLNFQFPASKPMSRLSRWHRFLKSTVSRLVDAGWSVHIEPNFRFVVHDVDRLNGHIKEDADWFGVGLDLEINGKTLPILPLLIECLGTGNWHGDGDLILPIDNGEWLAIPARILKPMLDTLHELYDRPRIDESGHLQLSRTMAGRWFNIQRTIPANTIDWRGDEQIRQLGERLAGFKGIEEVDIPDTVRVELRSYQRQGVNWLNFLHQFGFSGILADDMGLGKTIQTLTLLQILKMRGQLQWPALVVAPTSVISNWYRESERFTPGLRVALSHGPNRHTILDNIQDLDVLVTSYSLIKRDTERLKRLQFSAIVLDEAQAIKNPDTQTARFCRQLQAEFRLCLTGTPLENHLGELWALFDFLLPGFLGSQGQFNQHFRRPIETQAKVERQDELQQRIRPFLLRRSKQAVETELPKKTEIIQRIPLGNAQRRLYESIRLSLQGRIRAVLKHKGLARSHIEVLDALMKLRQACCHPALVKLESAQQSIASAKLEFLLEMIPALLEEGRKILLFSQFTSMLEIIELALDRRNIVFSKLTGKTRNRDAVIDEFRGGQTDVFLISLKAGGFGLNLAEADTVIHYDPWWNPATEIQATDRAHRIGQKRPVFVYKLIAENTVEEKILSLQARKNRLAQSLYHQVSSTRSQLSAEELVNLFA